MDNGASSYRRFLDGDDEGIVELIKDYKDGLTLYLNGYVNNIFVAEELMEETFFKLMMKKLRFNGKFSSKRGFIPSGEMLQSIIYGIMKRFLIRRWKILKTICLKKTM